MNKKEVQKRISRNGKKLPLSKFTWCEKTQTASTDEDNITMDFGNCEGVNMVARGYANQIAGDDTIQTASWNANQTAGDYAKQIAENYANQTAGRRANQTAGCYANQTAGDRSNQTAGSYVTQTASWCANQKAADKVTQTAGDSANQTAGRGANQTAGDYANQTAWSHSNHTVGSNSQVSTEEESIVNVKGDDVVIINRNVFEVILPKKGDVIQICPSGIEGHLINGLYKGKPHEIKDGKLIKLEK